MATLIVSTKVNCVEIKADGKIRIKRLLWTKTIDVNQISSIRKGFKLERIYFNSGKITLSPFFPDLSKLRAVLKESNPNIIVEDETENPKKVRSTIISICIIFLVFWATVITWLLFHFK